MNTLNLIRGVKLNMKIQLALDRISIEKAIELAGETQNYIDIFEVGTSLIKDYGMVSVRRIKEKFPNKIILADIKTMDEGEYEFHAAYKNGADIATVMGAASIETIKGCITVSKELGKLTMIDLMGVSKEKINALQQFNECIFCIHSPKDNKKQDELDSIIELKKSFSLAKHWAIAGGIKLDNIKKYFELDTEIVIVGQEITKSKDPKGTASAFFNIINSINGG